jgi:Lon protease-like protein
MTESEQSRERPEVTPMFPLGLVLLPGTVLPLHVFEPRYRALVQECLGREPAEFGVALIERGTEVGGGDERSLVATMARMVQVAALPDGRYALVTVGTERIRITAWLEDDPYPRALVEPWPDTDAVLRSTDRLELHVAATSARVRRCTALALELGDQVADPASDLAEDPILATYQLAHLAPLGPWDRQRLLSVPGAVERLDVLDEILDDVEALLKFRLGAPPE